MRALDINIEGLTNRTAIADIERFVQVGNPFSVRFDPKSGEQIVFVPSMKAVFYRTRMQYCDYINLSAIDFLNHCKLACVSKKARVIGLYLPKAVIDSIIDNPKLLD